MRVVSTFQIYLVVESMQPELFQRRKISRQPTLDWPDTGDGTLSPPVGRRNHGVLVHFNFGREDAARGILTSEPNLATMEKHVVHAMHPWPMKYYVLLTRDFVFPS